MYQITIFYQENIKIPLPHIIQIFVGYRIIQMADAVDLVPRFRAGNDLLFTVPDELLKDVETLLESLGVIYKVEKKTGLPE